MKNAVEELLRQSFRPTLISVNGARHHFFCHGCGRLDIEAKHTHTSDGKEVTTCSYCFHEENNRPKWESGEVYVGVPTEEEKRERFRDSPYSMAHIQAVIDLKIAGQKLEEMVETLTKEFPLLVAGNKWTNPRISELWNHGTGTIFMSQLTRNCKGVSLKEILVRDADGNLTSQIKDVFAQDHSGDISQEYFEENLLVGRGGNGGDSPSRTLNVGLRMLYPDKSNECNNWVQPKELAELSTLAGTYEHLVGKVVQLRKTLCVAAFFELFFDQAQCVLKAWAPDGLDLASVDWNDSRSITIDDQRKWLELVIERLGLCGGRKPIILDPSQSSTLSNGTDESDQFEDAIASEILADFSRITEELQFQKVKVGSQTVFKCVSSVASIHTH